MKLDSACGFLDLSGAYAGCANAHPLYLPVIELHANFLEIGFPDFFGFVVRVADIMSDLASFSTYFADF